MTMKHNHTHSKRPNKFDVISTAPKQIREDIAVTFVEQKTVILCIAKGLFATSVYTQSTVQKLLV